MAGVLVRLKLATLRHSWRRGQASMLGLGASAGLALAAWTWYQAAGADAEQALDVMSLAFAVAALIWIMLPVTGGSGGDPLGPEAFRLLPVRPRRLAAGLLAASAVGVLPLVTLVAFAGLVSAAAGLGPAAVAVAIVAVPLTLAFVIALSRVVAGAMGAAMESRLGLELAAIQYALLLALSFMWFPIGAVAADGDGGADLPDLLPSVAALARVLPTGWGAVAVESADRGHWLVVLAALAGLLATGALLVLAWAALLARRLRGSARTRRRSFRPASAWSGPVGALLPATPLGAVVGKELRAWARHPRRTVELRVAFWSAFLLAVVPGLFGAREILWPAAGAVVVLVAAVGFANVYGMDGTSLWLTVLAHGSARADVRGRQIAWLVAVGAPTTAVGFVLTAASGEPAAWQWVLAVLPALVGAAAGLSPLLALLLPAALPERRGGDPLDLGDDPGTGGALLLHGLIVFLALPLLAAPAALAAWLVPAPAAVLGGLGLGVLYAETMGGLAARRLTRRGPELLDRLRARPPAERDASPPSAARETPAPRGPLGSAANSVLLTLGVVLLVPQGLVALAFSLAETDVRSWFLALYLPGEVRTATSALLALLGASTLGAAWRLHRGRRLQADPVPTET